MLVHCEAGTHLCLSMPIIIPTAFTTPHSSAVPLTLPLSGSSFSTHQVNHDFSLFHIYPVLFVLKIIANLYSKGFFIPPLSLSVPPSSLAWSIEVTPHWSISIYFCHSQIPRIVKGDFVENESLLLSSPWLRHINNLLIAVRIQSLNIPSKALPKPVFVYLSFSFSFLWKNLLTPFSSLIW